MEGVDEALAALLSTQQVYHERQSEPLPPPAPPRSAAGLTPARPGRAGLQLCAVHALNNLFCNEVAGTAAPLAPMFDKASLDAIAEQRQRKDVEELGAAGKTFFNQHRSALGLGNFDVVVVETAVAGMGCTWQWFDARQGDTAPRNSANPLFPRLTSQAAQMSRTCLPCRM